MKTSEVQVFIPTYNRPEFIMKALASTVCQEFDDYEVIVSDNSTNDETERLFAGYHHPRVKYVRRKPSLPGLEHFDKILGEVDANYFMVFHDDDEMLPGCLVRLAESLSRNCDVIATGCNARLVRNEKQIGLALKTNRDLLIHNGTELFSHYTHHKLSSVPFDSYLYRGQIADKIRVNTQNGGKHSDVVFLIDVSRFGNILWLGQPLMRYTVHPGQDSATNNFFDRVMLMNEVIKKTGISRRERMMVRYRIAGICEEIRSGDYARRPLYVVAHRRKLLWVMLKYSEYYYFLKALKNLTFNYFRYREAS